MEDLGKITVPRQLLYNIGSREDLMKRAEQFLDEHEDESGRLSKKDAIEYKKMRREIDDLTHQINDEIHKPDPESEEKLRWIKATQAGTYSSTGGLFGEPLFTASRAKTGYQTSENYRRSFIDAIKTNFQDVKIVNFLQEGLDSGGGFLIPTELDAQIESRLEDECVFRQIARTIQTAGSHKLNLVATRPAATFVKEGQPLPFGDETFAQISLDAFKLACGLKASREFLMDATPYDIESHIAEEFGKAIGNAEEQVFVSGTGIDEPTGILTTIAANDDMIIPTMGTSLAPDDLYHVVYSLRRPYRKSAKFLMHDATLAQIMRFKTADQQYIWSPGLGAEPATILGFPVFTTPYMPEPDSGKLAIVFGDFSYYRIAERGGRIFRALHETFAANDLSAFVLVERIDAKLIDTESLMALKIK